MIGEAVSRLGDGALTEDGLREHVWPLFEQVRVGERERGEIYLANHSLGRPPDRAAEDVARGLALWYSRMDASWEDGGWLDELAAFRADVAAILGFTRADCIVPKTSAGQGLRTVLNALPNPGPLRIVSTTGEFDSVDFILKAYAERGRAEVDWVRPTLADGPVPLFDADAVCAAIRRGVDLVVVSNVMFGTGQIVAGIDRIVAAAHECGALVLVDAYHAAGVIPLDLERLGADFVVGGGYKYLRGGPGACWLAIHPAQLLRSDLHTLDTGWFAKKDKFGYERSDRVQLAPGGDAWMESTPAILPIYQARAGLDFVRRIGVERLRAYSIRQQSELRRAFADAGQPLFEPADRNAYGAFSLLRCTDAARTAADLRAGGLNGDARGEFVRLCPDVLTSADTMREAAEIAAQTLNAVSA